MPFADRTILDAAFWLLSVIYACNWFWLLGIPLSLLLILYLHLYGIGKATYDYYRVENVTEDSPYYNDWTWDNCWAQPLEKMILFLT